MLHESCQLLSKEGWTPIRQGERAFIEDGRLVWKDCSVSKRYRSSFCDVSGRFFSLCVDAYHPIPIFKYVHFTQGKLSHQWVEATHLTTDHVITNNFNTAMIPRINPHLRFLNQYLPDEDAQFRLIPDVVRFNRFEALTQYFGRSYVEDLNGREMQGVIEFSNYSALTIDTFSLSALGDNRRIERLSPRRLRVFPPRFNLRVDEFQRFHGNGYCISGGEAVLVRHNGKIAIVGTDL